jgi:serine protease inhibitor
MNRLIAPRFLLALVFFVAGDWNSVARAASSDAKDVQTVADGNNAFATDLYAQLASNDSDNLFFSPYSITTALAMTYNGARGDTATQMAQVLNFTLDNKQLDAAFAALSNELDSGEKVNHSRVYDLAVANALWGQTGFPFKNTFVGAMRKSFGAEIQHANFMTNPIGAAQAINKWVAQKTGDEIQDLIAPEDLTPQTRLVLVNAIYFIGNWESAFDPSLTRNESFQVDDQTNVTVPMMNQTETLSYMENDQLQMAELPYVGNKLSMVILLPQSTDGLGALEENLTAAQLNQWLGQMNASQLDVSVPRFQMESQFELADTLSAMGMPLAFSSQADFSGISTAGQLQISHVIHKTFVDVTETGTKAAAATAVTVVTTIAGDFQPAFHVDHPFLFLIRDRTSGAILFMGRVINPSE